MKPTVETDRETGTMKIDNVEFNVEQTKAINHFLEAFEKKVTEDVCDEIFELCEKKFRSIDSVSKFDEDEWTEVISKDELIEILAQIEQGDEV